MNGRRTRKTTFETAGSMDYPNNLFSLATLKTVEFLNERKKEKSIQMSSKSLGKQYSRIFATSKYISSV